MAEPNSRSSACSDNVAFNEILEQYDRYIIALAWKSRLRGAVPPESLAEAIDDLVQNVRFKLWLTIRKKSIERLKAYISRIVQTEAANMLRQNKQISPLPINEEGELYQDDLITMPAEGMQDPLCEIEQEESMTHRIAIASGIIKRLPPRQKLALICLLKDRIDDTLPLLEALRDLEVDVDSVTWPKEKEEVHKLKAALPAIRGKLRSAMQSPTPKNL